MKYIKLALIVFMSLIVSSCDSTDPADQYRLRISNDWGASITVRVVGHEEHGDDALTVEYGSIADGTVTDFHVVNETFHLYVDGEYYSAGSMMEPVAPFELDFMGDWTLTIESWYNWGIEGNN